LWVLPDQRIAVDETDVVGTVGKNIAIIVNQADRIFIVQNDIGTGGDVKTAKIGEVGG
jgi:hypothetical protein